MHSLVAERHTTPALDTRSPLCRAPPVRLRQVIAATNRVDILDPALLRSGRLDRKIEFPHPDEESRARIMQIHSRKMNVKCVGWGGRRSLFRVCLSSLVSFLSHIVSPSFSFV